eukprot:g4540.t1
MARYCSTTCQRQAWPAHRQACHASSSGGSRRSGRAGASSPLLTGLRVNDSWANQRLETITSFYRAGRFAECLQWCEDLSAALGADPAASWSRARVEALRMSAACLMRLRRSPRERRQKLDLALTGARALEDKQLEADVVIALGAHFRSPERPGAGSREGEEACIGEALGYFRRAIELLVELQREQIRHQQQQGQGQGQGQKQDQKEAKEEEEGEEGEQEEEHEELDDAAVAAALPPSPQLASALSNLGTLLTIGRRATPQTVAEGQRCLARAVAIRRRLGDEAALAVTLMNLAGVAVAAKDNDTAIETYERALQLAERHGMAEIKLKSLLGLSTTLQYLEVETTEDTPEAAAARCDAAERAAGYRVPLKRSIERMGRQFPETCLICLEPLDVARVGPAEPAYRAKFPKTWHLWKTRATCIRAPAAAATDAAATDAGGATDANGIAGASAAAAQSGGGDAGGDDTAGGGGGGGGGEDTVGLEEEGGNVAQFLNCMHCMHYGCLLRNFAAGRYECPQCRLPLQPY